MNYDKYHRSKREMKKRKQNYGESILSFTDLEGAIPALRRKLLFWFKTNARDYPWRKTTNWFHLLIAEMMLRRTRADQVVPVYRHFVSNYTTLKKAARLDKKQARKIFRPLGLRWRADHIHETIAYVKDNYSRRAPEAEELRKIPGVGDYSEAMLRNRLFGERLPTIDSNFVRFFSRLAGKTFRPENRRNRELRELLLKFVDSGHSTDLNLAVLDFTAIVCRPVKPNCPSCPLSSLCATGKKHT